MKIPPDVHRLESLNRCKGKRARHMQVEPVFRHSIRSAPTSSLACHVYEGRSPARSQPEPNFTFNVLNIEEHPGEAAIIAMREPMAACRARNNRAPRVTCVSLRPISDPESWDEWLPRPTPCGRQSTSWMLARAAVDKVLQRLAKAGDLARLDRDLSYFPRSAVRSYVLPRQFWVISRPQKGYLIHWFPGSKVLPARIDLATSALTRRHQK
jgi:hypothetical protein